ncbi:MAG: hypothetical protein J6S58_10025 [Lentisphaeria bacterium]|nr:hypothetical protein [Lentisphaeria bacterium]
MELEKISFNKLPSGMKNMFNRAKDVIDKQNYEYGVALLSELIQAVPGFSDARELLRKAEIEKTNRLSGFPKIVASIKSAFAVMRGNALLAKKDLREALNCAEEALAHIYSESGLLFLYKAALAMDVQELAIDALDRVLKLKPDDEPTIRMMIDLVDGVEGQAVRLLQMRQKIVELHPKDLKAQAELRAATAMATMEINAQKAAEAENNKLATRDNGTNAPDMSDLERGDRIIRSADDINEMIRRYEQVVEAGKGTIDIMRKLAEFYQKANRHEKAIETYEELSRMQGDIVDITVDKAIEKSRVTIANGQIEDMIASGASDEEINEAKRAVLEYQIECGKSRIKNFPNDLVVRFDQGTLYFNADMFEEALKEFRYAAKNPDRQQLAETYAARCYNGLGNYEKSLEIFDKLVKSMPFMDTQKMRTLYYMGNTFEIVGNRTEAAYCYRDIAKQNPNYQDVAQKLVEFEDIPPKVEVKARKDDDEADF